MTMNQPSTQDHNIPLTRLEHIEQPFVSSEPYSHHERATTETTVTVGFPSIIGPTPLPTPGANTSEIHQSFPMTTEQGVNASGSSSTQITSSDKLAEIPTSPSTPAHFHRATSVGSSSSSSYTEHLPSTPQRRTRHASEGSPRSESPTKRISLDSDRPTTPPAARRTRTSIAARLAGMSSDTALPPSGSHGDTMPSRQGRSRPTSPSTISRTPSRGASPLRFLPSILLHRVQSLGDEPFVPLNPFGLHWHWRARDPDDVGCHIGDLFCIPLPVSITEEKKTITVKALFLDLLPRQVYLHLLLRLPSLYWSRVTRIFEDAEVSRGEIQRMIDAASGATGASMNTAAARPTADGVDGMARNNPQPSRSANNERPPGLPRRVSAREHWSRLLPPPEEWVPPNVSPALARFKRSWEAFIDAVMREWKTLNVLSALLLSAVMTIFQVEDAASDPLTRAAALMSLMCALMSLCYGVMFIIRFGTMRSMYKASRWAEDARKTRTAIWWNCWVLLSMPAVWLAWSLIFFVVAILSFVWRTGGANDLDPDSRPTPTSRESLAARTIITTTLGIGLVYLALIIHTFKRYGINGMGSDDGYVTSSSRSRMEGRDGHIATDYEIPRGREKTRSSRNNDARNQAIPPTASPRAPRAEFDGRVTFHPVDDGVREGLDLEKGEVMVQLQELRS